MVSSTWKVASKLPTDQPLTTECCSPDIVNRSDKSVGVLSDVSTPTTFLKLIKVI